LAGAVDPAWHDADLALARRDDAGTVGPDQAHRASGRGDARQRSFDPDHVVGRDALGDARDHRDAGVGGFHDRVRREGGRHEDHRRVGAGLPHGLRHGVEDRDPLVHRSALAGSDAGHDLRAVLAARQRVEAALAAGQPLHQEARVLVDPDAHRAASTAFRAPSVSPSAGLILRPDSLRMRWPSSTLVHSSLTPTGRDRPISRTAATTPLAMMSHRMMPPKMLMRIARTFLSDRMMRNAFLTCSSLAPPPTS